jgi:hypothetical protein
MTATNKFNSRETYLLYRAAWKQRYKAISDEIRVCKAWRREEARATTVIYAPGSSIAKLHGDAYKQACDDLIPPDQREMVFAARKRHANRHGGYSAQWTCKGLALEAWTLLEELKAAKIEAQRQYQEMKAKLAEVP